MLETINNSEITKIQPDGIYLDDLQLYASEFLELRNIEENDTETIKKNYLPMLHYIFKNISGNINVKNIDSINDLFISYVGLCDLYNIIPTIDVFSSFIDIYKCKFEAMCYGREKANKEFATIYKNWLTLCKSRLTNTLTQEKGSDINRIFIAKAVYGMAETTAQAPEEIERHQTAEIVSRYALNG